MLKQRAGLHQAPCSAKLACLGEPLLHGKAELARAWLNPLEIQESSFAFKPLAPINTPALD